MLYVDAAFFTDIDLCVVSQRFMPIKIKFEWGSYVKSKASFLIGTSPELEMALFTLCLTFRANKDCTVRLGGTDFNIKTAVDEGKQLRSAFFVL